MTLTSQTVGDLLPAAVIASEDEETVQGALLNNPQFCKLLDTLVDGLIGATGAESRQELIETFCAMCFAIGWYARDSHESCGQALQPATFAN